jgi:hypothetical protein
MRQSISTVVSPDARTTRRRPKRGASHSGSRSLASRSVLRTVVSPLPLTSIHCAPSAVADEAGSPLSPSEFGHSVGCAARPLAGAAAPSRSKRQRCRRRRTGRRLLFSDNRSRPGRPPTAAQPGFTEPLADGAVGPTPASVRRRPCGGRAGASSRARAAAGLDEHRLSVGGPTRAVAPGNGDAAVVEIPSDSRLAVQQNGRRR